MGANDDVNFNFGAASALITEIDNTRRLLAQQKRDRMAQGASIRTTWKGPYAVEHDGDRTRSDSEAQAVLNSLDALRSKIQGAIDQAQIDQQKQGSK